MTRWACVAAICWTVAGCATSDPRPDAAPSGLVAADLSPSRSAREAIDQGRAFEEDRKFGEAEVVYRAALNRPDLAPEDAATLHLRLAKLLLASDHRDEALKHAHEALGLRPGWADAEEFIASAGASAADASGKRAGKKKSAGVGGDGSGAKETAKKRESKKAAAGSAADDELSALRAKCAELKQVVAKAEADRGSLKARVQQLEDEVRTLTEALAAKQRELDAKR